MPSLFAFVLQIQHSALEACSRFPIRRRAIVLMGTGFPLAVPHESSSLNSGASLSDLTGHRYGGPCHVFFLL